MDNISRNPRTTSSRGRRRTSRVSSTTSRGAGRGDYVESTNFGEGTSGGAPTRNYKWTPRTTRILLDLIIAELEAEDFTIRLPLARGKERIVENFYELTGDFVKWKPEMKGRYDYLRKLWTFDKSLSKRTGVAVDPTTRKIVMLPTWWEERRAEVGQSNKSCITFLQNNPLPFRDLLDQILGEHDVEQDDHYSPHMLGVHLQHIENEEIDDDDVHVSETEDYGQTSFPSENHNLSATEDDLRRISRSPGRSTREASRHSPYPTVRSSSRVRSTSTRRTHTRRANFEARIDGRFERMEASRGELLDVMRSRQNSKPTYGQALAKLESLPTVTQMNTFWWEANKLLFNDEDIRDGFMQLQSDENKIRYLERLAGVDRYGNPCDLINLRVTSSTSGSGHVRSDGSAYAGGGSFGGGSFGCESGGGGSVGGGSVSGGSVGGGSVGDEGFGLGTGANNAYENDNVLPFHSLAGFNSQTSASFYPDFGNFGSGSSSGNVPDMINFFNMPGGNNGKK